MPESEDGAPDGSRTPFGFGVWGLGFRVSREDFLASLKVSFANCHKLYRILTSLTWNFQEEIYPG